jgi:hypothetical protein
MEDSNLIASTFLPPLDETDAINEGILMPDGSTTTLLRLDFLSKKEMIYIQNNGMVAFTTDILAKANHPLWVDPMRASYL